jgi:hypothetical protein
MAQYRGYILALVPCLIVEGIIYYGLVGLGSQERLIWTIETVWLCATVWITLSVGERFERK